MCEQKKEKKKKTKSRLREEVKTVRIVRNNTNTIKQSMGKK